MVDGDDVHTGQIGNRVRHTDDAVKRACLQSARAGDQPWGSDLLRENPRCASRFAIAVL